MRTKKRFTIIGMAALVLLGALVISSEAIAQQLRVSPTRVVLDTNQRTAELMLSNGGDKQGTYRIVLTHKRMTEEGNFVEVDTPQAGLQFADDLVRYAPRQVVLAPGSTQRIRVMLRNTSKLEPGEYRSRLAFQAVPDAERAEANESQEADDIEIKVQVISSITIPLIVRKGNLSARAEVADLEIHDDAPEGVNRRPDGEPVRWLTLTLGRKGDRSIYGDLVVFWVPEEDAKPIAVGKLGGVAVYTEISKRKVTIPVVAPDGRRIDTGQIVVGFRPSDASRVSAQQTLQL